MQSTGVVRPHLGQFATAVSSGKHLRCLRITGRCTQQLRQCGRLNTRCYHRSYSSSSESPLHDLRARSQEQKTLVFQSTSNNPFHNLAIEHYLLTTSDPESRILLFYTNRPCVVIGRNQNPWVECNLKLLQNGIGGSPIDFVRRRSGGGTVFHDEGNLNFSVLVPNDKDFTRRKHAELVVRALNELHEVAAEYDGPENIWVNDRHDITMATLHNKGRSEFKVSGSAFKLTRGRALHHGTLLHSSPNLDNISKFLRSPGKEWIQAKGVESVRSPVANVFNVSSASERQELQSKIMETITREFLKFYKSTATTETVGDKDCTSAINPNIAKGVVELLTDEWRFEQTPRYDFSSNVIAGRQLTFSVKQGLIENPRLGRVGAPIEQRPLLEIQGPNKIHTVQNWCNMFEQQTVDDDQLATIAQVFPNIQSMLHQNLPSVRAPGEDVHQEGPVVVRHLQNGSIEEETGLNTVEEVRR